MDIAFCVVYYPKLDEIDDFNLIDEDDIPFHISIRPKSGQIIVDNCVGGIWQKPDIKDFHFDHRRVYFFQIVIGQTKAKLLLDGVELFSRSLERSVRSLPDVRTWLPYTLNAFQPPTGSASSLRGIIHSISDTAILGWMDRLLHEDAAPVLSLNGRVARVHSTFNPEPEFNGSLYPFSLVPEVPVSLPAESESLQLKVDFGALGILSASFNPPGVVESSHGLMLRGWVRVDKGHTPQISLTANGESLPSRVTLSDAVFLPQNALLPEPILGEVRLRFEAEIPAALWDVLEDTEIGDLRILCDGIELPPGPMAFSRSVAANLIDRLLQKPFDLQILLRALDHVRRADLWSLLAPNTAKAMLRQSDSLANAEAGVSETSLSEKSLLPVATISAVPVLRLLVLGEEPSQRSVDIHGAGEDIALHIGIRPEQQVIALNSLTNGAWGQEVRLRYAIDASYLLVDAELREHEVSIFVNGLYCTSLPTGTLQDNRVTGPHWRFVRPATALPPKLAGSEIAVAAPFAGVLFSSVGFVLKGILPNHTGTVPHFRLLVNEEDHFISPVAWTEKGKGFPGGSTLHFEIELPGLIWNSKDDAGTLMLRVFADDKPLDPAGLLLTRQAALQVIAATAMNGDTTAEGQSAALLAVEHIRFGYFMSHLDAHTREYFISFASRMNLGKFLHEQFNPPAPISISLADKSPERRDAQVVWRVQSALSRLLESNAGPVILCLRNVISRWPLTEAQKYSFFISIIPLLCSHDELEQLRGLVPLSTFIGLADTKDNWSLSLAVPIFVAEGQVDRAADLIYEICKIQGGWLNTDCIAAAVRQVERMVQSQTLEDQQAEKFRYAFIALLASLETEWFSRLHDRHLVEAALTLVRHCSGYTDHMRQDVITMALRHYGLSPVFWKRWEDLGEFELEDRAPLLQTGANHFTRLCRLYAKPDALQNDVATLHRALRFFLRNGSVDALFMLRETVIHLMLINESKIPSQQVKAIIETLLHCDRREMVRIAAGPARTDSLGVMEAVGYPAGDLPRLLRALRRQPHGVRFEAQKQARDLLWSLTKVDPDAPIQAKDIKRFIQLANSLPANDGESVDLITALFVLVHNRSLDADVLLARGEAILRSVILSDQPNALPAAVLASISRLQAFRERNRSGFVSDSVDGLSIELRSRFGSTYDTVLAPVARPALPMLPALPGGDVLVVVYSCRAYLDSRIQAIRDTWIHDLTARSIPYVVMVGGSTDDRLEEDVLHLAVSDDYEDLPQKTLRLMEWVLRHTNAQYVVKIDDDCYMNVENFFSTAQFRKYHYYGRMLERNVGNMDRTWHHNKAHSPKSRRIDRSPEPSLYADGGGVYSLSRFAITQLLQSAKTAQGQRLIGSSFMEDKLVGDLLALADIRVSNEDFESYQRRRTFGSAMPVAMWENTFFPSAVTPAQVAHLDLAQDQWRAHAVRNRIELQPKKLWPSGEYPDTHLTSNQLELLSTLDTAHRLQQYPLGLVSVVRNEMTMLPHFLTHYRDLGVKAFYFVDNLSDDGSREYLFEQPDVLLYSTDTEYRLSHFGVSWQQAVLGVHFPGRWAVVADADEILIYPHWRTRSINSLVEALEKEEKDALALPLVDMYPFGELDEADFEQTSIFDAASWRDREAVVNWNLSQGFYSNRVARVSGLRHRLMPNSNPSEFNAEKIAMFRYQPWVRLSEGLHGVANVRVSDMLACFAHFKYHKGFRRKILEEVARNQHYNGAAEYRRYANMLVEGAGSFGQAPVSVQLSDDGFTPAL